MSAIIQQAKDSDIPFFVALSYIKRLSYQKAQPGFWKYADGAEEVQQKWFEELLCQEDHIMLSAIVNDKILGFIIGKLVSAPEVYNPGGLTLMIDDFCVENEEWRTIGRQLIDEISGIAKTKEATQILIVSGAHDESKNRFLQNAGLSVASNWYVKSII